jgi:hypothetical protein
MCGRTAGIRSLIETDRPTDPPEQFHRTTKGSKGWELEARASMRSNATGSSNDGRFWAVFNLTKPSNDDKADVCISLLVPAKSRPLLKVNCTMHLPVLHNMHLTRKKVSPTSLRPYLHACKD